MMNKSNFRENAVEGVENIAHRLYEFHRSMATDDYVKEKRGSIPPFILRTKEAGFYFGHYHWQAISKPEIQDGHILVIGPPGSGKSKAVAINTFYTWKSPIFVNDIKGELSERTKHFRKHYKIINPADRSSSGYDPFGVFAITDSLVREASIKAKFIVKLDPNDKNPFFKKSAQRFFAAAILHFYQEGYGFNDVIDEIFDQEDKRDLAVKLSQSKYKAVRRKLGSIYKLKDELFYDVMNTLEEDLELYATDDDLREFTSKEDVFQFSDLDDGCDVYLQVPEDKEDEYAPMKAMIIHDMVTEATKRPDENKEPILFMFEEFGSVGRVDIVAKKLRTLRSKKITMALFIQDIPQLDDLYGRAMRDSIIGNCTYKLILGAGDPTTARICADICGKVWVRRKNKSYYQEQGEESPKVRISDSFYQDYVVSEFELGSMMESPKRHQRGRKKLKDREEVILRSPFGLHRLEKRFFNQSKEFV